MATSNRSNANASKATKLHFRNTRQGDVLPSTIDSFSRLSVDAATKAALTAAGAKLTVEIDAAGTRVFLADQRNGSLIGGPEDLAKIGGIRAFVTRERKEASGSEIAFNIATIAYRASNALGTDDPGYRQAALESSYGASVRPLLLVLDRVGQNQKKLKENTNPELAEMFKKILNNFFIGIKNVYFRLILAHTSGSSKKGLINDLLFQSGIPEYVHSKLTAQGLVLDRSQELARVLFPSDPSKGLALTLKEWRSNDFKNTLESYLLRASGVVNKLVNTNEFIRVIAKIDDTIGLDDETNPSVAKLLKCRVYVVPPMLDARYVTEPGSKTRAGWKFPSPSMDTIQGSINSLSVAMLRVYSANMQSVDLIGDYYATIVPGAVTRQAITPTNNLYAQWAAANDPNHVRNIHLLGAEDGQARVNMWRWLRTEMRLSEKAQGGKALARALNLVEDGTVGELSKRNVSVEEPDPTDKTKHVTVQKVETYFPSLPRPATRRLSTQAEVKLPYNLLAPLDPTELPLVKNYQKSTFPSKKGKSKIGGQSNNLTRLGQIGQELSSEIENHSQILADRMRSWLRGFSDMRIQNAAAKLALASFDELFLRDDESSDEEDASDDEDASANGVEV